MTNCASALSDFAVAFAVIGIAFAIAWVRVTHWKTKGHPHK